MTANRTALLLLLATMSGCVPFAWIAPPMTLEASAGARIPSSDETNLTAGFPLRIHATPFSAIGKLHDRHVDGSIGYQFIPHSRGPHLHGPTAEVVGYIPLHQYESSLWRLAFAVRGHVLGGPEQDWAAGGGVQLRTEWVSFADGPFGGCSWEDEDGADYGYDEDDDDDFSCTAGHAYGEGGVGLFAEAMYVDLGAERFQFIGGGLSFRIPASGGVGFVWVGFD